MTPGIDQSPSQTRAATPAFVRARLRAWSAVAAAAIGILISSAFALGAAWWLIAAVVCSAAAALVPRRWWWVGALGAVGCVMAAWSGTRFHDPDPRRLDLLAASGSVVEVVGRIASSPELEAPPSGPGAPGAWRDPTTAFDLRVRAVLDPNSGGEVAASGWLGVRAPEAMLGTLRLGDRVRITGVLRHADEPRNPGEPDWRRYANVHQRAGWMSVPNGSLIESAGPSGGVGGVIDRARRFRDAVRARATRALGADSDGVLAALILGERDGSFDRTYRVFQRAGVAHVLAVSGFHLAMLGWIVIVVVRLTGERGRFEAIAALCVVGTMLFMVPARAPIVRAGVLVLVLLLGDAVGRRWDRMSVLAWAALGLLVWRPSDALGLGYLLSVGVTALLVSIAERDRSRAWSVATRSPMGHSDGLPAAAWRWLRDALRINAACWAAATPTIVVFTGVFSVIAPIATVAMVPLAGVLLVAGWLQALLGIVWPRGAEHTAGVVGRVSDGVGGVAGWFDALPLSSTTVVGVGGVWAAVTTVCVVAWLFRWIRRRWSGAAVVVCVMHAMVASSLSGRVDGLRADMLDVGDGTCVLIRSGGDSILWDCGGLHRPVGALTSDAARALGVRRVRAAIVTHANLDHYNGMIEVAERLGIEVVYVPPTLAHSDVGDWAAFRAELVRIGVRIVPISAGDVISVGDVVGNVLWPGAAPSERLLGNDGSLVVRFAFETDAGTRSLLMCGDIQTAGVAGVSGMLPELSADVIEAPHHGSANEAAIGFVEGIGPSVVLQSTGPRRVGLAEWAGVRATTDWLSTGESGAVFAHIRSDGQIESGRSR